MIEVKTKLRKWGNSLGVLIPLSKIDNEEMKEGEDITVLLTKESVHAGIFFGAHKFKTPVSDMTTEIDKELHNGR